MDADTAALPYMTARNQTEAALPAGSIAILSIMGIRLRVLSENPGVPGLAVGIRELIMWEQTVKYLRHLQRDRGESVPKRALTEIM